jgi:hypothetical protein
MSKRFDLDEHLSLDPVILMRLRARIARRPGRWRHRMGRGRMAEWGGERGALRPAA